MSTQPNSNPFKTERRPEEPPQQSATSALRQQRVDEYEQAELNNPEAFPACLAAIQADQIRISYALGDAMKKMLTSSVSKPEQIHELEPSLNIYLRVTRQIERFGQLEIRQAELQQNADATRVRNSEKSNQPEAMKEPHGKHAK